MAKRIIRFALGLLACWFGLSSAQAARDARSRLDALEFNGLMTMGGQTTLSIYDPSTDSSMWIPVNRSSGGLRVQRFDENNNVAVVSFMGEQREFGLKDNVIVPIVVEKPMPKPKNALNVPKKSDEILKQEEQARMMVSDILEIGMKERARRKAQQEEERRKRLARLQGKNRE